jgi:hypothetical protein
MYYINFNQVDYDKFIMELRAFISSTIDIETFTKEVVTNPMFEEIKNEFSDIKDLSYLEKVALYSSFIEFSVKRTYERLVKLSLSNESLTNGKVVFSIIKSFRDIN